MASVNVRCTNCGREYPSTGSPYRCVKCGGIFDFVDPLNFDPKKIDYDQPGIWKYRHTFFSDPELEAFFLGEGDTPLLWSEAFGHPVAIKCDYLNPTGSFKDRGSSLITSFLHSRRIKECIEDSSGNAGASMAAYSAMAGIKLNIYAPEGTSMIKQKQIEAYGAEVINIKGSRSTVEVVTKQIADDGFTYASHAYLPFNLPGYATVAYEVFEQLGNRSPGTVMVPVGQGGLLLGLHRGFETLLNGGLIDKVPELVGVQARMCAPLWSIFNGGLDGLRLATDRPTLAEGIRVWHPIRGDSVLSAVGSSNGKFIAVDEEDITIGVHEFAQRGFHIEPTSAILWSALGQCIDDCKEPVVLILTGSGQKFH
jgi:threonine synthase